MLLPRKKKLFYGGFYVLFVVTPLSGINLRFAAIHSTECGILLLVIPFTAKMSQNIWKFKTQIIYKPS